MRYVSSCMIVLACQLLATTWATADSSVGITAEMRELVLSSGGSPIVVQRNQDNDNMVDPDFSLTSRPCPPYCIQPMTVAPGVETLGELELLGYMAKLGHDPSVLLVDSREGDWIERSGMIPGAVNIPWTELHPNRADPDKIADLLTFKFGVARQGVLWNFENAKTLILYCNGPWCGQSPTNIKQLLALGYPANKLKWYRGGMQVWKILGFNTVTPGK